MNNKTPSMPRFKSESQEADWWASQAGRPYLKQRIAKNRSKGTMARGSRLVMKLTRKTTLFFSLIITIAIVWALSAAPVRCAASAKILNITDENARLLDHIENYPDLEVLSISCLEDLQALPDSVGKLTKLKELNIDNGNGCVMNPVIPEAIGHLHSLEKLVLYGAQDPRRFAHAGDQPTERHKFPRAMSQLKNLTYLDLGRNGLEEIPSFVQNLPKLRVLGFAWNTKLKEIPPFLSKLGELTTLRLDADGLDDLPNFLNSLPKLKLITLGDNCKITQSQSKMRELNQRLPRLKLDFTDEYDCPAR
jgi:Leucine-rich repeat (LRR) protein